MIGSDFSGMRSRTTTRGGQAGTVHRAGARTRPSSCTGDSSLEERFSERGRLSLTFCFNSAVGITNRAQQATASLPTARSQTTRATHATKRQAARGDPAAEHEVGDDMAGDESDGMLGRGDGSPCATRNQNDITSSMTLILAHSHTCGPSLCFFDLVLLVVVTVATRAAPIHRRR